MIADWTSYALADFIPFTSEVYARLVERANAASWPLQPPALALGLVALVLSWRGRVRPALLILVPAWAVSAVVFHLHYYAELTWAATWFGAAFLAQALLLLGLALTGASAPAPGRTLKARVGAAIALIGLLGYPVLALLDGTGWRGAGVFGLHPDPTAVATLGLVMIALGGTRAGIAAMVPLLWLAIASLTLLALRDDVGWLLIGVVGLALAGVVVNQMVQARIA